MLRSRLATDVDVTLEGIQFITTRISGVDFMQFEIGRITRLCSQHVRIPQHLVRLDQFHDSSSIIVTMNPC